MTGICVTCPEVPFNRSQTRNEEDLDRLERKQVSQLPALAQSYLVDNLAEWVVIKLTTWRTVLVLLKR